MWWRRHGDTGRDPGVTPAARFRRGTPRATGARSAPGRVDGALPRGGGRRAPPAVGVACSVVDEHDVVLVRGRWEPGAGPRVDDREVAVVVGGRRRGLEVVVRD